MSEINNLSGDPDGTIPVKDAIELAANWRNYLETSGQAFAAHAFLIPIISFKNILLHNPLAEGVRAYIGLTDPTDPTSAKLVLVPVINGNDVPYLAQDGLRDGSGGVSSNVFDFSNLCPPDCSIGSPLNG
jgi:hypothetical protein